MALFIAPLLYFMPSGQNMHPVGALQADRTIMQQLLKRYTCPRIPGILMQSVPCDITKDVGKATIWRHSLMFSRGCQHRAGGHGRQCICFLCSLGRPQPQRTASQTDYESPEGNHQLHGAHTRGTLRAIPESAPGERRPPLLLVQAAAICGEAMAAAGGT